MKKGITERTEIICPSAAKKIATKPGRKRIMSVTGYEETAMSKSLQDADREAKKMVNNWTTIGALTGWIPGSALFLTGADIAMINQVANAYEVNAFDMDHLMGILSGAVGSAVAGVAVAEIIGAIPLVGWAVKSAGMAAKAKVIGDAVITYFRERSELPDAKFTIPMDSSDEEKPKSAPKRKTDIPIDEDED